jgi:hypothetical protein
MVVITDAVEMPTINKRNFYLSLFSIYSALPVADCLQSFTKIFNEVFIQEKPQSVQKYFLLQCMVVEMSAPFDDSRGVMQETHSVPFSFNFAKGTSKYINYMSSDLFKNFINKSIREVKRRDRFLGDKLDLHKRGRKNQNLQVNQTEP